MAKVNRVKNQPPARQQSYFTQGWDAYDEDPHEDPFQLVKEIEIPTSAFRAWWVDGFVSHRESDERLARQALEQKVKK